MLTALCAFNTINVRIVYLKNSAYISPLSQNYIMCGYKSGWVRVFSEVSKGKQKQKKPNTDFFFCEVGSPFNRAAARNNTCAFYKDENTAACFQSIFLVTT